MNFYFIFFNLMFVQLIMYGLTIWFMHIDNTSHYTNENNNISKNVNISCNHSYGKGGIMIVADEGAQESYKNAIRSMKCYGLKHGYPVLVVGPETASAECNSMNDFMFKRHCMILNELSNYDWLAVFDGDVGIVNADKCLESLLKPEIDVVHEERFHNGEVQAGNYIIKNNVFGRRYLRKWMEYDKDLTSSFHNSDNGALHIHLLKEIAGNKTAIIDKCYNMWKLSNNLDTYDQFVGCVMDYVTHYDRQNDGPKNIRLVRRGHGFVRDLWVTKNDVVSPIDFFVHAIKNHVNFYDVSKESEDNCGSVNYNPILLSNKMINISNMMKIMATADLAAYSDRPKSILQNALIGYCWPNCKSYW